MGALVLAFTLFGCGTTSNLPIELMPAPAIYQEGRLDPFPDVTTADLPEQPSIFYVTDRAPSARDDKQRFYKSERGHVLRAGKAEIELDPKLTDWDDVRRITFAASRDRKYKLKVTNATEFGVLPESVSVFDDAHKTPRANLEARNSFAREINHRLDNTESNDVYIFVHGYKVDFQNPLLIASELYHFLGYQGAFIAYSWPATPHRLAYFKDLETAGASARNLRILLETLGKNTRARRIHIVAYSAGTRVAVDAVAQLALLGKKAPIGNVILVGSDVDRQRFAGAILDGLLDVPDRLSVYLSSNDGALGVASFLFAQDRLGQVWEDDGSNPDAEKLVATIDKLALINVSAADGAASGNGHGYFRSSPWASSDILSTLLFDLSPRERGLEREPGKAIWEFPPDYIEKLSRRLASRTASAR